MYFSYDIKAKTC